MDGLCPQELVSSADFGRAAWSFPAPAHWQAWSSTRGIRMGMHLAAFGGIVAIFSVSRERIWLQNKGGGKQWLPGSRRHVQDVQGNYRTICRNWRCKEQQVECWVREILFADWYYSNGSASLMSSGNWVCGRQNDQWRNSKRWGWKHVCRLDYTLKSWKLYSSSFGTGDSALFKCRFWFNRAAAAAAAGCGALRFCISDKLPHDANTAGHWVSLCVGRLC